MFPVAIFIGGPTASHKTEIAFNLQSHFPSFIVNSDSMQVYDQLEILTNRPIKKLREKYDCNLFSYTKYPDMCNVGSWQKKALSIVRNKKNTFWLDRPYQSSQKKYVLPERTLSPPLW